MNNIEIAHASLADIEKICKLHMDSLPDDLFSKLGHKLICEIYKIWLLSDITKVVAAKQQDEVVGYIVLSKDSILTKNEMRQKTSLLIFKILVFILTNPHRINEVISIIKPSHYSNVEINKQISAAGEIYFIAVDEQYRRVGVGMQLINFAKKLLLDWNKSSIVVKTSNDGASNFYLKHGFKNIGKEFRGARVLDIFTLSCL